MTKRNPNARHGPLHPVKVIDGVSLKLCGRCKKELPVENFGFRTSKILGRRIKSECKQCLNERRHEWKEKNPQRMYYLYKRTHIRNTYGLSMETLDLMRQMQGNKCAICKCEMEPPGVHKRGSMHIDHDHATGRVRALLCSLCNSAIGQLKEDPEIILAAYRYIKHQKSL